MMPISDDNRGRRRTPIVTFVLIALNVLVWLYQVILPEQDLRQFIYDFGVVPADIMDGEGLFTLISTMFLHGGWMHIIGNMLFLWVFGDNVEDIMGHGRYLAFYLLAGIAASGAQVLSNPESTVPMIGASGAVSGLLAAYLISFPRGKIVTLVVLGILITTIMLPAWMMIGYWIVLQVIQGALSLGIDVEGSGGGVAWFAHIGGFAAGALLVFLFRDKERVEYQRAARERPEPERRAVFG